MMTNELPEFVRFDAHNADCEAYNLLRRRPYSVVEVYWHSGEMHDPCLHTSE